MFIKDNEKKAVPREFQSAFTKPVTFQLCDNQGGYNPATGKTQFPIVRGILPIFTTNGKVGGGGVSMEEWRYATAQRKGKDGIDYTPQTIYFVKGQLICDPSRKDHLELYYFLENHPKNRDGNNSDGSPIFYRVNYEKMAEEAVSKRLARHRSEEKILVDWDKDHLIEIAFAFGDLNAEDRTVPQLQEYLLKLVDRDPVGFNKQTDSEDLELKAKISKGMALKVIVEKEGIWYWGVNPDNEDKSLAEITRVRSGEDPKTRLIVFFNRAIKSENLDYFLERLEAAQAAKEAPVVVK